MGIYSNNRFSSTTTMVDYDAITEADDNYNAVTGCAMAFLESQQNDLALFNATITNDFQEVAALQEGYEVINESASGLLEKIKQIFIKLLAKIKGIFKAFIAKLSSTFGSNKDIYNKYEKQINKYYNWKDFKVKNFRKLKGSGTDATGRINNIGGYDIGKMAYHITVSGRDGSSNANYTNTANSEIVMLINKDKNDQSVDSEDINKYLINDRLKSNDLKKELDDDLNNMNEAFMDCVFEDADTEDNWKTSDIINGIVGNVLKEGNKIQENVEKCNKNLTSIINKIIDQLSKEQSKIGKALGDKNGSYQTGSITVTSAGGKDKGTVGLSTYKDNVYNTNTTDPYSASFKSILNQNIGKWTIMKNDGEVTPNVTKGNSEPFIFNSKNDAENEFKNWADPDDFKAVQITASISHHLTVSGKDHLEALSKTVSFLQRVAGQEQELITKLTTARLTTTKFLVSQARKVWASAAAYSSTEHKNEGYEFYTAIGEASAYDFMSDMEALD